MEPPSARAARGGRGRAERFRVATSELMRKWRSGQLPRGFAIDLFSGSGRLSAAWRQHPRPQGISIFELDVKCGPEHDLTRRTFQKFLRTRILDGSLRGAWIGLPCNSFSTARNCPNGPASLRNASFPLGLPGLKPWGEKAVRAGNALASFCGGAFKGCSTLGDPSRDRESWPELGVVASSHALPHFGRLALFRSSSSRFLHSFFS